MFAIPGIIIGLFLAAVMNVMTFLQAFQMAKTIIPYTLSSKSIIYGSIFCIFLPLISNILPIKQVLAKNLRETLDVHRQNMTETKVQQIKLANLGVSPAQLCLSLCLIVLGYMTYYVAPVSFLKQDMKTFTLMLNFVIIFMVLGLSFLSLLLLKYFEIGVLKTLL